VSFSDDRTYGFNRADARELVATIGGREKILPSRGFGGAIFFVCRLTSSWSSNAATASLFTVDGATITDTGDDITVYDPLSIFATLTTDDYGWCFLQGGRYYLLQSPCPA
jgi:hypothetical protein